jgi:hypothetical protein
MPQAALRIDGGGGTWDVQAMSAPMFPTPLAQRMMAMLCACAPLLSGCVTGGRTPLDGKVLVSGTQPLMSMPHVKIVDDPFAAAAPVKVLKGGPLGKEEPYQNKCTFPADHFVVPAGGRVEVEVVVAMRRLTDLKVEIWSRDPTAGMKFRQTLPAVDGWQTVAVPVDASKIPAGAVVNDITVFQVGKDPKAELYVRSVTLRQGAGR